MLFEGKYENLLDKHIVFFTTSKESLYLLFKLSSSIFLSPFCNTVGSLSKDAFQNKLCKEPLCVYRKF